MNTGHYFVHRLAMAIFFFFTPLASFSADAIEASFDDIPEHRLILNVENIKIQTVLKLLAEFSGYNLIVDDKVKGYLTLHLNNIPWQQALDIVLQTQGLDKRPIPNGWFIATQSEFFRRDKKHFELQAQQKDLAPMIPKLIQMRYGKASDVADLLKNAHHSLLSTKGKISVDERTNSLWIQDSKDQVIQIARIIKQFDKPIPQIAIEARIVSVDQSREKELGVRLGLALPASAHYSPTKKATHDASTLSALTMDLPLSVESAGGLLSVGMHVMRIGKNALLDLELSALESEGGAQVISTPHLITADQQTAYIETGEDIPYQGKTGSGSGGIVFKKAVLALKVTPRVMLDHRVILDLAVNQDQPSNFTVLDVPAIKARGIKTQVILKNGETVVLGGIHEHFQSQSVQRVPFLGTLPVIGYLFRRTASQDKRHEILIFITPTIIAP